MTPSLNSSNTLTNLYGNVLIRMVKNNLSGRGYCGNVFVSALSYAFVFLFFFLL